MPKTDPEREKQYISDNQAKDIDWTKAIAAMPQGKRDEILRRIAKQQKPN